MEQGIDIAFAIAKKVDELINEYLHAPIQYGLTDEEVDNIKVQAQYQALEDLRTIKSRDPAAKSCAYILNSYACYQAVLSYRIAHQLVLMRDASTIEDDFESFDYNNGIALLTLARLITEQAKVKTQIDIHPSATIGERFVIDHGVGTVIGETAEIGDDCYFLEFVVLGGRAIADGQNIRRHPKIGSNVQISGGVRIYGPITIGNNVIIEGLAVIIDDIPNNAKVKVVSTLQICKGSQAPLIFGVVPSENDTISIIGKGLTGFRPMLMASKNKAPHDAMGSDSPYEEIQGALDVVEISDNKFIVRVKEIVSLDLKSRIILGIIADREDSPSVFVTNAYALQRLRL